MAENIGILVIFFVLLVIGLIFYSNIQKQSISFEAQASIGRRAIQSAHTAASLTEMQCSLPLESETGKQDCVDLYKLKAFIKLNQTLGEDQFILYYYDVLRNSRITIKQVYPEGENWTIYDNPKSNYTDKIPAHIPVFIYDELANRPLGAYYLGDMEIEVYI